MLKKRKGKLVCFWWGNKWYKIYIFQAVSIIALSDGIVLSVGRWSDEFPDVPLNLTLDKDMTIRWKGTKQKDLRKNFAIVAQEIK